MAKWSALSPPMSICDTHVKFDNLNGLSLFTRGVYRDLTTFQGAGRVSVQQSAFPGPIAPPHLQIHPFPLSAPRVPATQLDDDSGRHELSCAGM
jgi:hypothetical protein